MPSVNSAVIKLDRLVILADSVRGVGRIDERGQSIIVESKTVAETKPEYYITLFLYEGDPISVKYDTLEERDRDYDMIADYLRTK